MAAKKGNPLTKRENEIFALLATGMSNRDMAKKLWVTEQTIKYHLSNVYKKLGVENRTQAAHIYLTGSYLEAS